jgi:rRNA-processing protein FCF1
MSDGEAPTTGESAEAVLGVKPWLTESCTVRAMLRAVLDSNAVDPFIDIPGAYEAAEKAIESGDLELLITHVNIDELAETGDLERRCRLLLAAVSLGQLVPTGAFVLDFSRLNFARLNEDREAFEAFRSGNIDHTRDALLAATAQFEQCTLITNDSRLAGRARDRGVPVLTSAELLARVGFQMP